MEKRSLYLLLLLSLFIACNGKDSATHKSIDGKIHIKTATVVKMDMADTIRFYGKTHLRYESIFASQFDGRLSDFSLFLGDHVSSGQKMGEIIPAQREAILHVLPQIDSRYRSSVLKQIKTIPLISPISGTILKVYHHNGDVLQKGEPIVHIGNLKILDVLGDLPLNALPLARNVKKIQIHFINFPHPDLSLPVAAISGKVNQQKQTVTIRLTLNNPDGLFRPGMIVQLYFPGTIHWNTLTIPRTALLEHEGIYSVFVVKDNKVQERIIELGIKHNDRIEVLSGLKEGEQVATQKAYSLTDGMEVIVE